MKNIKAAFFDVDNTLFDHRSGQWIQSSIEAIRELQKRGIQCFACSARPYYSFKLFGAFDSGIKWDGGIFAAGTTGFYKNKLVYTEKIPHKQALQFIDLVHKNGGVCEIIGIKSSSYSRKKNQYVIDYKKTFHENEPHKRKIDGKPITCFLAFVPKSLDELIQKTFPDFYLYRFHEYGLDIKDHKFSKGDGIARILKYLGISKDEAISFGDDVQDISMGEHTGTFVCVGNGKDAVKEKATFVCDDQANDGIYKFLKEQKLI